MRFGGFAKRAEVDSVGRGVSRLGAEQASKGGEVSIAFTNNGRQVGVEAIFQKTVTKVPVTVLATGGCGWRFQTQARRR